MTLVLHRSDVGEDLREPQTLAPRRRRLSTVLKQQRRPKGRPYIVSVHRKGAVLQPCDDTVRSRSSWKDTLVGPQDTVVITYLPLGGGGRGGQSAGKQIGMAVAMLALSIAAPMLIAAIPGMAVGGSLTLLGKIATAGLIAGVGYFLSKATKPKANADDTRPVYGVSGGGNLPRPGDRIPVHYGKTWAQPDLSQGSYFYYDGEDQVLLQRMTLGLGEYDIHQIRVGNALMWRNGAKIAPFTTAEVEIINPGERSSLVPSSVFSATEVNGSELPRPGDNPAWMGPFTVVPLGETTKRIQLDVSWPQGIYVTHPKKSQNLPHTGGVEFQYATIDADGKVTGAWKALATIQRTHATTRAQRVTHFEPVPEGRYAVRARNLNPKNEWLEAQGVRFYDQVMWDGLRSYLDREPTRPEVTEIAIKVRSNKGTGNMTSFSDIWVQSTRRLPVFNGISWTVQRTRHAIWAALDILRNETYGNATPDDRIDLARFYHYAGTLTENNTFDGTIRGPVSVAEALSNVLGVIRAEPVVVGDYWSISRDEPRTLRKHVITRRQIVRDTSGAEFDLDMQDGSSDVIVEFYLEGDPRKRAEQRITIGPETLTPRRIQLFGVTEHDHAVMLGRWYAAAAYYRREHRLFSTELLGRNLGRNDAALIDTWFLDDIQVAGVETVSGLTVTIDADVTLPAGAHAVFRNEVGKEWGPVAITATATPRTFTVSSADADTILQWTGQGFSTLFTKGRRKLPVTVMIGTLAEVSQPYIIRTARPDSNDTVQISAVVDADEVWHVLGEQPPPMPPITEVVYNERDLLPILPYVRANVVQRATALTLDWAVGQARSAAYYVVDIRYGTEDVLPWENIHQGPATSGTAVIEFRDDTEIEVRARAVNALGVVSEPVYTTATLFKPVIDTTIADLMIQLEMLGEQVKRDIESISKVGEENLTAGRLLIRNQLQDLNRRVEELAAAAATEAAQAYDNRDLTKVALDGRTNEIFAAIQEETKLRVSEQEALAERITTMQASIDEDITASLQEEQRVRATQDESLSQRITTLDTRMASAESGLSGQSTAVSNLTSRTTTAEGQISTQAGQITSLDSRLTTAEGTVAGQATAVSNLTTRVSNAEGRITAEASRTDSLSTTVGGHTSTISQHTSSIDGIKGEWGIAWVHDGNAYGGIRLTGMKNLVTGAATVQFGVHGDMVVTGSIWGSKIVAGSIYADLLDVNNAIIRGTVQIGDDIIDTAKLKGNSVSNMWSAVDGDSHTTYVDCDLRAGARVAIVATAKGSGGTSVNLGVVGTAMRIQAEGNDIATTKVNFCRDINGTVQQAFLLTTTLQHRYTAPSAGSYRFRVTSDHGIGYGCAILVMELIR